MSRLIDADIMRDEWLYGGENEYVYDANSVLDSIDSQPTVNAVVLPCNVGDTVYEPRCDGSFIQEYTVISIHISSCGNLYGWELKDGRGIYSNINGFSEHAIGKTVYLTREEAEAALVEMDK